MKAKLIELTLLTGNNITFNFDNFVSLQERNGDTAKLYTCCDSDNIPYKLQGSYTENLNKIQRQLEG